MKKPEAFIRLARATTSADCSLEAKKRVLKKGFHTFISKNYTKLVDSPTILLEKESS